MKLLFDQNISFRLIYRIKDIYPEAIQVKEAGLENSTDIQIWKYAKNNEYTIVTFDVDFYDYSMIKGYPPKIIWLRIGNKTTYKLEEIFRKKYDVIKKFISNDEYGCLEINNTP